MDGVMMRNGEVYGLAVRIKNGAILGQRLHWRTFLTSPWARLPFVRGFPVLLETLINGIHALNRSVELAEEEDVSSSGSLAIFFSVLFALLLALALFVVAPHLLSLIMLWCGLGTDVEGLSFHLWDGFYKCAIFIGYIWAISFVPDIRKVFEYHGAEHKIIHAWETGEAVESASAFFKSRLHPRCGTTFLLFVITLSIVLQAIVVPLCLHVWSPANSVAKHIWSIGIKLALVAPISAIAYELIRYAAALPAGILRNILQTPGLLLQRLTTREPSEAQIEVAIVALAEALDSEDSLDVHTADFVHVETALDSGNSA